MSGVATVKGTAVKSRVALVTNFCPHYRRPLFAELSSRFELSLIFTSAEREWYWQNERQVELDGPRTETAKGAVAVARALALGKYDVVVASLTGRAALASTFATARATSVPIVLWVGIWDHPHTWPHRLSRPIVRHLYRSADAIVTYGTHVSRFIESESGRKANVFVAPQAVENERFSEPASPSELTQAQQRFGVSDLPTVAFVGRLASGKGIEFLLEASARTASPHKLVIAGAGDLLEDARRRAEALRIGDRVTFVGRVEQQQLRTVLQACDFLVLPSVSTPVFKEPWGLVVNEAMNCGLPVIVTDAVGAAAGGLVKPGETGLVVPERDSVALASAMDALLSDDGLRRQMGNQAKRRVQGWNYGAAADAFEAAVGAALQRRDR